MSAPQDPPPPPDSPEPGYTFTPHGTAGQDPADDEREPRPVWGGRLLLSALGVLLALNVLWMVRNCGQLAPKTAGGGLAPEITVPRLGGGTFRLSETRGRPVLVDFWATWCGPCKESLPILDRVYARYRDRGLDAIAIETEGAAGGAKAFMDRLGLKLPVGLGTPEVSEAYDVSSIPHLVLIDAKGRVRRVFHGVHSAAELSQAVEEAFAF
jgi:thiol-disulfide isomerase/thioredoxin